MVSAAPAGTALFLKRWLRQPFAMGAVVPSGRLLTQALARTTLAELQGRPGHVVELGAGTGEVTSNISGVAGAADETGVAAGQVLDAASELSRQSEHLTAEVSRFLDTVRAA